jgi:hypothetical protein
MIDVAVAVIVLEKPSFKPGQSSRSGQSNGKHVTCSFFLRLVRPFFSAPLPKNVNFSKSFKKQQFQVL